MIQLNQITKRYENNFVALDNLNLNVRRGEIYGVLGKSGAGKSTLLRCVNLLERPCSGEVIVDQVNLTALNRRALRAHRHKIGVIFQHYNLLDSATIFDNIALPLKILGKSKDAIQQKVTELLELVNLTHKAYAYPAQLSGGQKQRVGIARALAADPQVLLCDEATSALDAESTTSILNLLRKINRELNLTILLITHELEVVKQICDRVGIIHEGRLIEEDSTVNIFSAPKHAVTKQLIQHAWHHYQPEKHDDNSLFLKLTFIGQDNEEPIISSLVKQYNVTVNIRQALIEKIQDTTVGFTIFQLKGEHTSIKQALAYIQTTNIIAEVLHATA